MNRLVFFVFAAVLLAECTLAADNSEDAIIGKWKGTGAGAEVRFEFEKDHACRIYGDDTHPKDSVMGTWTYSDGKYAIIMQDKDSGRENKGTGQIDGQGRLIITEDEDPSVQYFFEISGPSPPTPHPQDEKKPPSSNPRSEGSTSAQMPSEDTILGKWKGMGMIAGTHMNFEKNHSYVMSDEWDPKDKMKGTWTYSNGIYSIILRDAANGEEGKRTGHIDDHGRLDITEDPRVTNSEEGDPTIHFIYEKEGAKPRPDAPAGKPPVGEWRYAYTSKSPILAASPSPFDVMIFEGKNKVKLKMTMAGKDFDRKYELSGDLISISTESSSLPKLEFSYHWEDKEEKLILSTPLSPQDPVYMEWVFLKPAQFSAYDLKGTWLIQIPEEGWTQEAEFTKDGLFLWSVKDKSGSLLGKANP